MPVWLSDATSSILQGRRLPLNPLLRSVLIAGALIGATLGDTSPAQAQLFGWMGGRTFEAESVPSVPPGEVLRRLSSKGYQLNAGLQRNGGVYLADVTDGRGRQQRLVIDAYRGRVLQAFTYGPPRPAGFMPEPRGFAPNPGYQGPTYASRETYPPSSGFGQRPVPADPRAQETPNSEPRPSRANRSRAAREAAREAARDNGRSAAPSSEQPTPNRFVPPAPSEATVNPTQPREALRPVEPAKSSAAIAQPGPAAQPVSVTQPRAAAAPRVPAAPASQDNKAGIANGVPINPLD